MIDFLSHCIEIAPLINVSPNCHTYLLPTQHHSTFSDSSMTAFEA